MLFFCELQSPPCSSGDCGWPEGIRSGEQKEREGAQRKREEGAEERERGARAEGKQRERKTGVGRIVRVFGVLHPTTLKKI